MRDDGGQKRIKEDTPDEDFWHELAKMDERENHRIRYIK